MVVTQIYNIFLRSGMKINDYLIHDEPNYFVLYFYNVEL